MTVGELNAILSADTSDFLKGLKQAEKAVDKWEKETATAAKTVVKVIDTSTKSAIKSVETLGTDFKQAGSAAKQWETQTAVAARVVAKTVDTATKSAMTSIQNLGKKMSDIGSKMSIGITLPIVAVGGGMLKMAMDATESENLFEVSMGSMATSAREFSEKMRKELGLNAFEVRKQVGILNTMTMSMGLSKDEAYKMSTGMVQLANDMASFFNIKPEEAFEKLKAGITGEAEPLKALGILVNETTVKTWALTHGIIAQGQEMTETQKVTARYGVIMEATKNAQGDLARTIDSPTNKLRIMKSQVEELAVKLGTTLLPALLSIIKALEPFLKNLQDATEWFTKLSPSMQTTVIAAIAFITAIGPLSTIISGIISLLPILTTLLTGLGIALAALLTPIGLVLTAIGLFSIAAYKLITDWDGTVKFLQESYPKIAAAFGPLPGLVAWIIKNWEEVSVRTREIMTSLTNELYKIGKNLIQGLVDGIMSQRSYLINKVSELANMVPKYFRSTLQIHSPSRVMEDIGYNLMAGLAIGITNGTSGITEAMESVGAAITAEAANFVAGVASAAQGASGSSGGFFNSGTFNALASMSSGQSSGSKTLSMLSQIPGNIGTYASIALKIKDIFAAITGSKAKKQFKKDTAAQSEANLEAAKEELQVYKDYAAAIRSFGKESLVSIMGLANETTKFLEGLDLEATGTKVKKKVKTWFGLGSSTAKATLWTYTFDKIGAESATAWLDRFMQIAGGLSSAVGSTFANGIKAFLSNKADWVKTLKDGIKDAIIDAITTAVLQATIIKGALGNLLGQLATGLTAGEDVSGIIAAIGAAIPTLAAQLQAVLTPLRGAIMGAFPGGVDPRQLPQMADGGIVRSKTTAVIGEAGPEAVIPLSKWGAILGAAMSKHVGFTPQLARRDQIIGANTTAVGSPSNAGSVFGAEQQQTIIVQLDGRVLSEAIIKRMPGLIRMKTGVAI